jgi:hypothetical protein
MAGERAPEADVEIVARAAADELRFDAEPEVQVRFPGAGRRDSHQETRRRNVDTPAEPGKTYSRCSSRRASAAVCWKRTGSTKRPPRPQPWVTQTRRIRTAGVRFALWLSGRAGYGDPGLVLPHPDIRRLMAQTRVRR